MNVQLEKEIPIQGDISKDGYEIYDIQNERCFENASTPPIYSTNKQPLFQQVISSIEQNSQPQGSSSPVSSKESNGCYKNEGSVLSFGCQHQIQQQPVYEQLNGPKNVKNLTKSTPTNKRPNQFQKQLQTNYLNLDQKSQIVKDDQNISDEKVEKSIKLSNDMAQQLLELQQQNTIIIEQNKSKPQQSRLCKSTESNIMKFVPTHTIYETESKDEIKIIVDYFLEKTQQIKDQVFKKNLNKLLTKNYFNMRIDQAECCLQNVMCYYEEFLKFSDSLKVLKYNTKLNQSFREYGLEKLLNLFSIKFNTQQGRKSELPLLELQQGIKICQQKFNEWINDYYK